MAMSKEWNVATLVIVAAVVYAGWAYVSNKKNDPVTCALSGAAFGAVVSAMRQQRNAGQIAGMIILGVSIPIKCKEAITKFIDSPEEPVTLKFELPTGGTQLRPVTGNELLQPYQPPGLPDLGPGSPTTPPPLGLPDLTPGRTTVLPEATISQILVCARWNNKLLYEWCLKGDVPPPP